MDIAENAERRYKVTADRQTATRRVSVRHNVALYLYIRSDNFGLRKKNKKQVQKTNRDKKYTTYYFLIFRIGC